MLRFLVPVDGSANSDRAVKYVIDLGKAEGQVSVEVLVLNVQPAVAFVELMFGPRQQLIEHWSKSAGTAAGRSACALLDAAGMVYTLQVGHGEPGATIAAFAQQQDCDLIVMGSRGLGAIGSFMVGSVAAKVIHLTNIPVTFVK